MNTIYHPPIFCNNCPLLAVAELDGEPLCMNCLQEELANSNERSPLNKIGPLPLEVPDSMGLVNGGSTTPFDFS